MIHGGADLVQRVLDSAERLLWERQDAARVAAGWQVVRIGRWHRMYRHPALVARAVAARSQRRPALTRERAA